MFRRVILWALFQCLHCLPYSQKVLVFLRSVQRKCWVVKRGSNRDLFCEVILILFDKTLRFVAKQFLGLDVPPVPEISSTIKTSANNIKRMYQFVTNDPTERSIIEITFMKSNLIFSLIRVINTWVDWRQKIIH